MSMRTWTIAYTALATWVVGWLAGRFGVGRSLFAAIILFSPTLAAWRMLRSSGAAKRREYLYLAVVVVLAVCGTGYVTSQWIASGVDRMALFDSEYWRFKSHVDSMPEYQNVEVSFTHRKGGRVYLHGHVATKEDHDRLLQLYEGMVRNNVSGCYDGVEYPGKDVVVRAVFGR